MKFGKVLLGLVALTSLHISSGERSFDGFLNVTLTAQAEKPRKRFGKSPLFILDALQHDLVILQNILPGDIGRVTYQLNAMARQPFLSINHNYF